MISWDHILPDRIILIILISIVNLTMLMSDRDGVTKRDSSRIGPRRAKQ